MINCKLIVSNYAKRLMTRSHLPKCFHRGFSMMTPEEMDFRYLVRSYNHDGVRTLPGLAFTHGKKCLLYDKNGNKYLDFSSGIAVSAMGHGDDDIAKAVADQVKRLTHTSNLYHSLPALQLARTIIENTCFDRLFFSNSGTEANEAALKFSRLYGRNISKHKTEIVAFKRSFHGRSMGSLSVTHKFAYREPFAPLIPGVSFADYNNLESLGKVMHKNVCAVIVEPVQGEGGLHPSTREFFHGLRELCTKYDAILICDEVQTGLGRLGYFLGHEPYGVHPDIVTLAKPLAGGLPIGATLVTSKVAATITPGTHGTTFGGNPVSCRAAKVVVDRLLSPGFLQKVRKLGKKLYNEANSLQKKYPSKVKEIRAPITKDGLFVGIEFYKPVKCLITEAAKQGLLIISAGETTIRLCPPLVVTETEIDSAINILDNLIENSQLI